MAQKSTDTAHVYKSEFDFGANKGPIERTSTIKDLLKEINYELNSSAGKQVDIKALAPVLDFITILAGRKYKSSVEQLDLSTLKTIKLLYLTNDSSDRQMLRTLRRPGKGSKSTFEFYTLTSSPRNSEWKQIIDNLLGKLRVEMSDETIERIDRSLLTTEALLDCIERENIEILAPLYGTINDAQALTGMLEHVTEEILKHSSLQEHNNRPLHETVYTYLRTLPFFHFVLEYQTILDLGRVDRPVIPVTEEMAALCALLCNGETRTLGFTDPITSINGFPRFLEDHALPLGKLVEKTSGIKSTRRDLLAISNFVCKVLNSYLFNRYDKVGLDEKLISLLDCVAALCAVRYQQKVRTNYSAYWVGQRQSDISTRPLGQMCRERPVAELYTMDYIPQGTNQLMLRRFVEFCAGITGSNGRLTAITKFRVARLESYTKCFLSNDIRRMDRAVGKLYIHCCDIVVAAIASRKRVVAQRGYVD